jgi:hypothetical protein
MPLGSRTDTQGTRSPLADEAAVEAAVGRIVDSLANGLVVSGDVTSEDAERILKDLAGWACSTSGSSSEPRSWRRSGCGC